MLVARLLSWKSSGQKRLAVALGAALLAALLACAILNSYSFHFPYAFRFLRSEPYPWANTMSLHSISMVSADDGWAVGTITGEPNTLLMHYHKGQWTILPKPVGLDDYSEIDNVAMVTASDGWALASIPVYSHDRSHTSRTGSAFLRYMNGAWAVAGDPLPFIAGPRWPSALVMTSATDGWATVEDHTLHYDGAAWREITELTARDLGGGWAISATSPSDVWIAGNLCVGCKTWPPSKGILHYDGRTWTETLPQAVLASWFSGLVHVVGVSMSSASEGWAVANTSSGGAFLHYLAGRWMPQGTVDSSLQAITMRSTTDGWAVSFTGEIYRYANGRWTAVASPVTHPLYDIAIISPGNAWAVGSGGVLLHYRNGSWEVETNVVWSKQATDEWK